MGPSDAVMRCLTGFATFSGRSGRREFWWFALFAGLVGAAFLLLAAAAPALAAPALPLVASLVVPLTAAAARRLQDTGRPAALLLVGLVPVAGQVALALLLARRGEAGDNRFGDNPRTDFVLLTG